jgi:Tfp pilus assembly protein PilF
VAAEIIEAYLIARTELLKMTAEGIGKALQYLREITFKAPDFAPGLAYHALCLGSLGFWGHAPIREVIPAAKQMALTALEIDDSVDAAHLALAMSNWLLDWDLAAAEREFRRTIEVSPSNPDAHILFAIFLASVGRPSEASAEIRYALRLDPTSLFPNHAAAWIYLLGGQHGKAEAQARRTIELFPDSLHAYFVLGWTAWRQRRSAEAVAAFEKAVSLSREASSLAYLGHVYGRLGRRDEATSLLRELEQLLARGQAPPSTLAAIHAGLGNTDSAFDWLETAYRLRDDKLFTLTAFPPFDPLRSDPRFTDLVHRMGLAPPSSAQTE